MLSLFQPPRRRQHTLLFAGLLLVAGFADSALAQSNAAHRALAQKLFQEGRALMLDGNFEQACPKLAESQRLEPAGGTLLNLATCYEKQGKTATAWVTFEDARATARRDGNQKRVDYASRHIEALSHRLSYVTVVIGDRSVRDLALRLDGRPLAPAVWDADIPLDPGLHRIEASAPGRVPWSQEVTIREDGERVSVTVALLADSPTRPEATEVPPASSIPAAPRASRAAAQPRAAPEATAQGPTTSTYGLVLGGLGVACVGVGSYFGLRAMSSWSERNDHCDSTGCDRAGLDAAERADTHATLSNVGFGAGVLALAVGAVLVLSDGSGAEAARITPAGSTGLEPSAGRDGAGVQLRGTW